MKMKPIKKIAVLLSWQDELSHSIYHGICDYARLHLDWELLQAPIDWLWEHPDVADWNLAGMMTPLTGKCHQLLEKADYPLVSTATTSTIPSSIPQVDADHAASGRMAAEALLELGHEQFGCLCSDHHEAQAIRADAFIETLHSNSVNATRIAVPHNRLEGQEEEITRWLVQQPKPLALFATNDHIARAILKLCLRNHLAVPGEIALLGCENNRSLCEGISPGISSVALPYYRIGYEAAQTLNRVIQGETIPSHPILLPPERVVTRTSTDTLAVPDPHLRSAIQFIREHTDDPVDVNDIAHHAGVSLRVLQKRFKEHFNRTPIDEVHRAKVERIKELLISTTLSPGDIGDQVAFSTERYMRKIFKRHTNQTPGQYRKHHRH